MDYEKGKKLEEVENKLNKITGGDYMNDYKPLTDDEKVLAIVRDAVDIIREVLGGN